MLLTMMVTGAGNDVLFMLGVAGLIAFGMALTASNVHVGPARIFIGVTNPASGLPPTLMPHTAGVPATGEEVGYTTGDAIFRKSNETSFINAEQALGPIGSYLTAEIGEVEFTAMERVYNTLRAAFDNTGTVNDGTKMLFYGGGLPYTLRRQSVMLSSARTNQAGKYEISVLYSAFSANGFEVAYRKTGESTYRIVLRGLYDDTRVLGDQLFQHYVEK